MSVRSRAAMVTLENAIITTPHALGLLPSQDWAHVTKAGSPTTAAILSRFATTRPKASPTYWTAIVADRPQAAQIFCSTASDLLDGVDGRGRFGAERISLRVKLG